MFEGQELQRQKGLRLCSVCITVLRCLAIKAGECDDGASFAQVRDGRFVFQWESILFLIDL